MKLTLAQTRRIALHQQLYCFADNEGKTGTLDVIKNLSYIQLDTISVIERAHHHTLYNRVIDYHPDMLNDLLANDKTIWEYWAHAASYLPIEDYPFYKIRMQNFPNGSWEKKFWELHNDLAKPVLDRIRKDGPLSTKHFEDTRTEKENQVWGNIKPAKIMLELLMWKGDLIVTARDKFQRVYDLTERVIPHYKEIEIPSVETRAEFMVYRALLAHGIASESEIVKHLQVAPRQSVSSSIKKLAKSKEIIPVQVEGLKDTYFSLAGTDLENILQQQQNTRVWLLSPFDNAVILRNRVKNLFNYDYALECYVTPAKRKFGYWNCPMLWQDNIVGMMDPKADRKTKILTINSIHIDKTVWKQKSFQTAFAKELTRFASFNGCKTYTLNTLNLL